MKYQITPYDWFSFSAGFAICIILLYNGKFPASIIIVSVILVFLILESFRTAKISEKEIDFFSIRKREKISWDSIKKIEVKGGFKVKLHANVFFDNKKIKFFLTQENFDFLKELCIEKKIIFFDLSMGSGNVVK